MLKVTGSGTYFYESNNQAKYRIRIAATGGDAIRNFSKMIVPKHHCFVLGDNRDDSDDSRSFGAIPIVGIIGKASFIYVSSSGSARFGSLQ